MERLAWEEEDGVGPKRQPVERREAARALWTIRKYGGLQVGPRASKTYIMARFKEVKNCNGKFQNR